MRLTELLAAETEYDVRDLPLGDLQPTHRLVPAAQFTHGHDAVDFAEYCGYDLLEFQEQGLIDKLGANLIELRDGSRVERWAAQETQDVVSRRNGKTVEFEVLILFALFVLGEKKIMYTAHRDDTAKEVFDHVVAALKRVPRLWAELDDAGPRYTNGQRAIKLRDSEDGTPGGVCYFRTRTTDSARGQGYDRLILDESQSLTEAHMAALMPLMTGSVNGQLNFAGSPGDLRSTVQAGVWRDFEARERGLCYRGWHSDPESDFDDLDLVARTNPRLGRGLSYEFIAKEFRRMSRAQFGRERCGAATYPREAGAAWVIPETAWLRTIDEHSQIGEDNTPRFVLEADPELEYGTIGVAGRRDDGAMHLEVVAHDPGVAWMLDRAKELQDDHNAEIWLDPKGPCGFMLGDLTKQKVKVHTFEAVDLTSAWSWLSTAANPKADPLDPDAPLPDPTVRQRGGQLMVQALAAAEIRKLLDRLTLRRTVSSETAQGPLIGPMLAGWAVVKGERRKAPPPPPKGLDSGADPASRYRRRPARTRTDTSDVETMSF